MSTWDVKGKFAIVTGAGSGINHAFAEQLLNAGCSVIVADLKLRPEAQDTLAKFPHPPPAGSPSAVFHKTDQPDWSQLSDLWTTALQTFGRIDLICPGAGIWEPPSSSFWESAGISPLAQDDASAALGNWRTFAVNTMGPLRLAQLALDYWLQHKNVAGNILFVTSLGGYAVTVGTPLYYASKAALNSVTQAMAQMRTRLGIRVAAVAPGPCFTPLFEPEYARDKVRREDLTMTPEQCAEVMLRVVRDPEYGDGQVVEAMMVGSKAEPRLSVRVVPFSALLPGEAPLGEDNNILKEEEKLWTKLQTKGMR